MKCPKCLNEVEDSAAFCSYCGFNLRGYRERGFSEDPESGQTRAESTETYVDGGYTAEKEAETEEQCNVPERKFAGALGAFLFGAAGGLAFFLLNKVGFIASVSGLIGIKCAMKGYKIFGKRMSKFGVIISIIATAVMIIIGWYAGLAQDVYDACRSWYESGEYSYMPSFGMCFALAWTVLLDIEVVGSYLLNLLIGLGMAALGCWGTAKRAWFVQRKLAEAGYVKKQTEELTEVPETEKEEMNDEMK